jgi:hypothetical protein
MPFTYTDPEGKEHELLPPLVRDHNLSMFFYAFDKTGIKRCVSGAAIQGYMPDIPFHKTERMFRRYENQIRAIVQNLPDKAVSFSPGDFSIATAMGRLRDAMSSVMQYGWKTDIDLEKLQLIRPQIEVVVINGMIVVRKRGQELPPAGHETNFTVDSKFGLEVDNPSLPVLEAIATLHGAHLLTLPTKIKNVPRKMLDDLAARYDIAISEDVDHFVLF